jgi:23S rRNA (adenine2503-C2)-methyltransferase
MKPYALDQRIQNWEEWFIKRGGHPFASQQIMQWLYLHHELDPLKYSNIALPFRQPLAFEFDWTLPKIDSILRSSDDSEKVLIVTQDGRFTESVIMTAENRITLCVSCQVGCKMGCTFCQTGKMGFSRNLSVGEILAQLILANLRLKERGIDRKVSNVVFMGMGEPLDNYDEVVQACRVMIDPKLFGLSKNRVTISTSGLIPEIQRLGQDLPVSLAISLHSADEEQRSSMMPVNRKYPLSELKKALLEYPSHTRHGITFEYVMINGKNDSEANAKKLVKFLHGLKAKVNLIPMNPHPGNPMQASDPDKLRAFQKYLSDRSIPAPIRYSRGRDVSGACGQLAAKRKEELELHPRAVALARKNEKVLG